MLRLFRSFSDYHIPNPVLSFTRYKQHNQCFFILMQTMTVWKTSSISPLCIYHLASDNKFNVEQAWTSLKQILVSGCNQFIPKLKISSKPKPKWFNQHIRHLLNCARTLHRLVVKHPSASNKAKLTASENHLQSVIQDTKDDQYSC